MMKKTKILITLAFILCFTTGISAQSERQSVKKGNENFEKGNYTDAEVSYLEALEKNRNSISAKFNLGNALYRQGKFEEARTQYQVVAGMSENDANMQAQANHNIGNTFMSEKKYPEAVDAFKKALRSNPKDEETRYNLALANSLLKQQQQQQQQQSQQDENKDKENEQEQENQDQNPPQQQDESDMSKENAQQILDSFAEEEKELLQRLNEEKTNQGNRRNIEKDW